MFLIMSGAYVGQELQSEFGRIPPSFLPLGNRRLFQHQVKLAPVGVKVYLSIPESYKLSKTDVNLLETLDVTLIRLSDDISLGASLVASVNLSEHNFSDPLHILYGDTLFTELPKGDNFVCISEVEDFYDWAMATDNELDWLQNIDKKTASGAKSVVSGYFKFSHTRELMRCIIQSKWNLLSALNQYKKAEGLITVFSDKWLDFGHVNTYYASKAHFTTQRAFNELKITREWIEKSSVKNSKIAAEANWFSELPYSLRGFIPQYLGAHTSQENVSYRLEYLHNTALNELYVFSELPATVWKKILHNCVEFLSQCYKEVHQTTGADVNSLDRLFDGKTRPRLNEFCNSRGIELNDTWSFNNETPVSLQTILEASSKHLPISRDWPITVLHGDFCFSNILYDFRSNRIKTIDPRGTTPSGEMTIFGDIRYDIAKLSHSIIGMYDWIIAGYYQVSIGEKAISLQIEETEQHKRIQQYFIELIHHTFGLSAVNLMAMQIQLFLSMLPLHNDDKARQDALFANAFRLYQLMKRVDQ